MAKKINKAKSNATINIEDEVRLLLGSDLLNLPGVVQQGGGGEVLLGVLADEGDPLVWVVDALDPVADAHDQDALLLSLVHKIICNKPGVKSLGELSRGPIQRPSKPVTNSEQT